MSGPPVSPNPAQPRFCADCGATLTEGTRFCTNCGSPVGAEAALSIHHGFACYTCGGNGSRLKLTQKYCPDCRWLRPLGPGYEMPPEAFIYNLDAQAMAALANSGPLRSAAQALANRVGRPWLESTVNGIRLGPDQLPQIFNMAIDAARIMGLPHMPEIYISGDQMWDSITLGSETDSFIVLGSVLNNFKDKDLFYILGREMGHCAAGHALWKTVIQFMSGKRHFNRNIMGEGVLQFLNPSKIVESAIDAPLMAWARHSEITADRAGALVVGKEDVARRVMTQWALKSFPLYAMLNMEAFERQIDETADQTGQLGEMTMSSTPYLGHRLRLMRNYFREDDTKAWLSIIDHWTAPPKKPAKPEQDLVRMHCIACQTPLSFPRSQFPAGGGPIKVRCPNTECRKVLEIAPLPPKSALIERVARDKDVDTVKLTCAACQTPFRAPKSIFAGKAEAHVRCPNKECRAVLVVRPEENQPKPTPRQAPELLSTDT